MTLYHEQRQLCITMEKFQKLNFIILRLRMNLSCNDTISRNLVFLGGNMHKTPNIEVILCGRNGF